MIECICGHGDDGKHSEMDCILGHIVVCPYVPDGQLWGVDLRYINPPVVITNIGEGKAAPSTETPHG